MVCKSAEFARSLAYVERVRRMDSVAGLAAQRRQVEGRRDMAGVVDAGNTPPGFEIRCESVGHLQDVTEATWSCHIQQGLSSPVRLCCCDSSLDGRVAQSRHEIGIRGREERMGSVGDFSSNRLEEAFSVPSFGWMAAC